VLQCVAVCCSVLQCVAGCCSVLQFHDVSEMTLPQSLQNHNVSLSCNMLQCVAVSRRLWNNSHILYERLYHREREIMLFNGNPKGRSKIISNSITHVNVSCHTYECVTSHKWMRLVKHMSWLDHTWMSQTLCYGVATISRLLQIMGLFCKRVL